MAPPDKRFWLMLVAAAALVGAGVIWGVRDYRRMQTRQVLDAFAAFQRPPLELSFPRLVPATETNRKLLEPGVAAGFWSIREGPGRPSTLDVRLTDAGQKWFSVVGNELVATFTAGTREALRVVDLEETFPSRRVHFRYVWRDFHPGSAVLGDRLPEVGREYEGDALLFYEQGHWRLMHWTTPDFDDAVAAFKSLENQPE